MVNNLVSIVVPLYNYSDYIEDLINSVKNQTYTDWELIISDDCSTDNPEIIIDSHIKKDNRIQYLKLPKNKGYAAAKNAGIKISKGEFIVVLDADDVLSPKSIADRVLFLKNSAKHKWVHAKAYEFKSDIKKCWWKKRKFIRKFKQMRKSGCYSNLWNVIHAQTVLVKRECYLKVGLYEESMRSMSDKEMWARIQNNIGIPGYLDKFVSYYRMHGRQMHRSKEKISNVIRLKKQLSNFIKIRKNGDFSSTIRLES